MQFDILYTFKKKNVRTSVHHLLVQTEMTQLTLQQEQLIQFLQGKT